MIPALPTPHTYIAEVKDGHTVYFCEICGQALDTLGTDYRVLKHPPHRDSSYCTVPIPDAPERCPRAGRHYPKPTTQLWPMPNQKPKKPDHEFPHVTEVAGRYLRCSHCQAESDMAHWLDFVGRHANCKKP